ncbi:hypothetical protein FRC07_010711 [Ceratobasidium sp. 392]|nr:hypothetical protein FRC07_010711 [Ceratobasidium sp. 392]
MTRPFFRDSTGEVDLQDPSNPELATVPRNLFIFPTGFGSKGYSGIAAEFLIPTLEQMLIKKYSDDHVESIYVRRIEYCKEKKKAQHEFIVITVESTDDPRLRNFLLLERTSPIPLGEIARQTAQMFSPSSCSLPVAVDKFRVSQDGTRSNLFNQCSSPKYKILETLDFENTGLRFYQLLTLARTASDRHEKYTALSNQCYWYASLVWDSTRRLLPSAAHTQNSKKGLRGKFGKVSILGGTDESELSAVVASARKEFTLLKNTLFQREDTFENKQAMLQIQQEKKAGLEMELVQLREQSRVS